MIATKTSGRNVKLCLSGRLDGATWVRADTRQSLAKPNPKHVDRHSLFDREYCCKMCKIYTLYEWNEFMILMLYFVFWEVLVYER